MSATWQHQLTTLGGVYSGVDMVVFMAFPGYIPVEIGTASTISYNTYREKKQVRTLGRISAKGFTKGPRTISGRLIFTVFKEHIVEQLKRNIPYLAFHKSILMDELPPFDILVSFGNEYGSSAQLVIQGITTVDEQKTLSVEELFTENIFTYLARRIELMKDTSVGVSDPYDPSKWMSTVMRDPASELIGKFQINDLYLDQYANDWDFQLPDAGQYALMNDIPLDGAVPEMPLNAPSGMPTLWGVDDTRPPSNVHVFVQVYDTTNKKVVRSGNIVLTNTTAGVSLQRQAIKAYPKNELNFDTSNIHFDGDKAYGFYFIGYDIPSGNVARADFTGEGYPTTNKTSPTKIGTTVIRIDVAELTDIQLGSFKDVSTGTIQANQTTPKQTEWSYSNFDNIRSKSTIAANEYLQVELKDSKGNPIPNHAIRWTWKLNVTRCDNTVSGNKYLDSVLPFLNEEALKLLRLLHLDREEADRLPKIDLATTAVPSLNSEGVQMKFNLPPSKSLTLEQGGILAILKDMFFTFDKKGNKLYWGDIPKDAVLEVTASTKVGSKTATITWAIKRK